VLYLNFPDGSYFVLISIIIGEDKISSEGNQSKCGSRFRYQVRRTGRKMLLLFSAAKILVQIVKDLLDAALADG
jgi:hypothetical protein